MEKSAKDFYEAAEAFASGDWNYEKVADIPLSKAAMNLSMIASVAPPNEKELAFVAQKLESDESVLVLDDDNSILVQRNVLKLKRRTSPAKRDEKADPGAQPSKESSVSTCSKSPEVLFYIAIPSSLGLLPYLNTMIPKDLRVVVGWLFGLVFAAATMGVVLVARGRDNTTDMEVATIVGAICFTAFSCLVMSSFLGRLWERA